MAPDDVQTTGYAVVPSFLSATEIDQLRGELAKLPDGERRLPRDVRSSFASKIEGAARLADPAMDRLRTAVFHTRVRTGWQTESTNLYIHPAYLSLWVPLEPGGLTVVGFDALASRAPELGSWLRGRGSVRAIVRDDHTVLLDSARRERFVVRGPQLIDELGVALAPSPGDLLVLRPDVLQRGSDGVAISFRVIDSQAVVTRQRLVDMGAVKFDSMARMRTTFARRLATFQIAQRDSLSIDDYDAIYDELEAREKAACKQQGVDQLPNVAFEDLVYELARHHARRAAS